MNSPYILPEGNVQIAFSGGRTSGYMLLRILIENGDLRDGVEVTFQNTGREMPETLDFVQECSERWKVPITWLEYRPTKPLFEVVGHNSASRNGEPFEALIAKRQAVPNQHQKFCSAELKTLTAKRYLVSKGWKRWTSMVGFRADEEHRQPYIDNRATTILPLREAGVTKEHIIDFWKRQPFDLRLPVFRNKTIGGNCDGCFLKSEAYLASLAREMPERAEWWERQEQRAGHSFSSRFTRSSLRGFVQRQGDWIFDDTAYLCQVDGGECTA